MLTGNDIKRLEEEQAKVGTKLVVIETMQFFEIEVPADTNTHDYVNTDECRERCAEKITSGFTDLKVERVLTDWDPDKEIWT